MNEYDQSAPETIRPLVEEDLQTARVALGWVKKAQAKLQEKFPDFPLEYEEKEECPHLPWEVGSELICMLLSALSYGFIFAGMAIFGIKIVTKITFIFSYLALLMFPAYFAVLAERSLILFAFNAALSLYLGLGLAIYRSFRPPVKRSYPQYNDWRFGLASASLILFLLYIRPDYLGKLFEAGRLGGELSVISMSLIAFTVALPFALGSGLGCVIYAFRKHYRAHESGTRGE